MQKSTGFYIKKIKLNTSNNSLVYTIFKQPIILLRIDRKRQRDINNRHSYKKDKRGERERKLMSLFAL